MSLQDKDYTASQAYDDYTEDDKLSVFGGEFDLWGLTDVTAETFADPTLKVVFDADLGNGIYRVDDVKVEVFFTLPYAYNPEGFPHPATKNNTCTIGIGPAGVTRLIIAGVQGNVWTSDDRGETWIERDTGIAETLWCVRAFEDGFYACGDLGTLLYSTDGTTWTKQDAKTVDHLFTVGADHSRNVKMVHGRNGEMRRKPQAIWQITGR